MGKSVFRTGFGEDYFRGLLGYIQLLNMRKNNDYVYETSSLIQPNKHL